MAIFTCTLRGTIAPATYAEIFSHSIGVDSSGTTQVVATAVRDAWVTAMTTGTSPLNTMFPDEVVYTEATAAQVLDPMVPDLSAAYHAAFSGGQAGVGTGSMLPAQTTLCVSLRAGTRPNGSPFRGRFYLPPMTVAAMLTDGLANPGTCTGVRDQVLAFLTALRQAGHLPVIWSRTVDNLVGTINEIRVGNRFDTIRSRRNATPETYVTVPF